MTNIPKAIASCEPISTFYEIAYSIAKGNEKQPLQYETRV